MKSNLVFYTICVVVITSFSADIFFQLMDRDNLVKQTINATNSIFEVRLNVIDRDLNKIEKKVGSLGHHCSSFYDEEME